MRITNPKYKNQFWLFFLCLALVLSLIPVVGVFRSLPILADTGEVVPLGSFFEGTPIYTESIIAGGVIDYTVWAANRSQHAENVYDLKPRYYDYDIFPYPPLLLFTGYVLDALGPLYYYAWLIVLLAAIVSLLYLANILLIRRGISKKERIIVLLLILASQSLIRNIGWGHYYIVLLPLFLGVFYFLDHREIFAGVCAGMINSFLIYGFLLTPYFIIKRKWKALMLSIIIPCIFLGTLYFVNRASFFGFFSFLFGAAQIGGGLTGSFSIMRLLSLYPLAKLAYLTIQAILFMIITYIYWGSKDRDDAAYFSFLLLFMLVCEPWFSGHHSYVVLIPYLLLYSRNLVVPYTLTEVNYHSFFTGMELGRFTLSTIGVFTGIFLLYVTILAKFYKESKGKILKHGRIRLRSG